MDYTIISRPTLAHPEGAPVSVIRTDDDGGICQIPFSMENRDARRFVSDWKARVTVKNPDGSDAAYSDAAVTALGLTPPA